MRCSKAKNRLSSFVSNELTELEKRQVGAHLQKCNNCQADYHLLLKTYNFLGKLKRVETSPDFSQKLYQKIENSNSALLLSIPKLKKSRKYFLLFPREILARAALVILSIVFTWTYLDSWTLLTYKHPVGKWPEAKYSPLEEASLTYQFLEVGLKDRSGTIVLKVRIGS